jgi:hypothetical protein
MLVLLLDSAVLIGLYALFSGGNSLSWGKAIGTAFVISLFSYACIRFLAESLGILALLPCLLVAPLMLFIICDLPLKQSAIAGTIFTVYRIILTLIVFSLAS